MTFRRLTGTFIIIVAALIGQGFSTPKLTKTKIGKDITVSLPQGFYAMSPQDIAQRLPSVRAPLGAYTSEDRLVDFSVNISATQWPEVDYEMTHKFFKASIYNLYDKVDMIGDGVHDIHKKKLIYFEFESRINGTRMEMGARDPIMKYTYIQYFVEPKRTIVFSFNCPRDRRMDWQETAREIMKTIRVK